MRRLVCAITLLGLCAGCQQVTSRAYYPPDEKYAVQGTDGLWRGAVQSEDGKRGVPDPSQKHFEFNLNFLGL